MRNSKENILPDHESEIELAERFNEYFMEKVFVIHKNLKGLRTTSDSYTEGIRKYQVALTYFRETLEDDVARLIQKSPKKSCSFDPIQTWLLNKCKATFTPTITRIVNSNCQIAKDERYCPFCPYEIETEKTFHLILQIICTCSPYP